MGEHRLNRQSPHEFFQEQVAAALQHQHVEAEASTTFYVVNLLSYFVRMDPPSDSFGFRFDDPLAVRLARAMEAAGPEQRARLRNLGDTSLFICGFFSDSLNRKLVDLDYYIALGGFAYASLGRLESANVAQIFQELATKFQAFVDVLSEVSERSSVGRNADLLRLYERWLRTGSRRSGEMLAERGIVPNTCIGKRFLQ